MIYALGTQEHPKNPIKAFDIAVPPEEDKPWSQKNGKVIYSSLSTIPAHN